MTEHALTALLEDPDETVRQRALLVRDALSLGAAHAAEQHGVTRQTAAKWLQRFRSGGADRLLDEHHRRTALEETRHAVLTAPLWMPTTKWSSRTIASAVGVSQSHVARVWAEGNAHTAAAERVNDAAGGRGPTVSGLLLTTGYSVLVVKLHTARRGFTPMASAPASPRTRRALRTILAADLVRDRIDSDDSSAVAGRFWNDLAVSCVDPSRLVVVTSVPGPVAPAGVTHVTCAATAEWLALLNCLASWRDEALAMPAAELEADLRAWHREGRRCFSWVAPEIPTDGWAERTWQARARSGTRRAPPERVLADDIIATVREGVATGQLAGGDRVTERFLAGRLRTTRGQVRAALRVLEGDGLVTITRGHAAVVPVPTVADVVETYAARRALGALMVRAAMRWTAEARRPVAEAMAEVERSAADGDNALCNQADLVFQHALADASGLTRIGPMLQILGLQVQMFIAVVGITYAFPVEPIVARNRAIVAAIDDGNDELAVQRWREKIDEALAYMLQQVEVLRVARRDPRWLDREPPAASAIGQGRGHRPASRDATP